MKLLPNTKILTSVLLSSALLYTVNASATEVTLERSLAATVQAQGQKVMQDLSAQLANSIRTELQQFSIGNLTTKPSITAAKVTKAKPTKQKSTAE